jgi:hypothetical protein
LASAKGKFAKISQNPAKSVLPSGKIGLAEGNLALAEAKAGLATGNVPLA